MKLIGISDTHEMHNELKVPDGDVLIHCGDFSLQGGFANLVKLNTWFGGLPHKYKIVIAGNHDFVCKENYDMVRSGFTNATYLENSGIVISGVDFWGSPYTPEFNDWAFMKKRGDEIAEVWKKIPHYVDVLITHGPAMGVLDVNIDHEHCGCWDLGNRIKQVKPKVHVFGHIHEAHGSVERDGVRHFNCSVVNEYYEVVNKPTEIEL